MLTNRNAAGELLATKISLPTGVQPLVVGIPRGGVIVAAAIARSLKIPLDVLPVKKLAAPDNPELAVGALTLDGVSYVEWRFAGITGADEAYLKEETARKAAQVKQQELMYRRGRGPLKVKDKTVILVDDGAATGSTFEAAIRWLRKKKARSIIAVLPVVAQSTVKRIKPEVQQLIVLEQPKEFQSVGQFYEEFAQVEDEEVVKLLASSV